MCGVVCVWGVGVGVVWCVGVCGVVCVWGVGVGVCVCGHMLHIVLSSDPLGI